MSDFVYLLHVINLEVIILLTKDFFRLFLISLANSRKISLSETMPHNDFFLFLTTGNAPILFLANSLIAS